MREATTGAATSGRAAKGALDRSFDDIPLVRNVHVRKLADAVLAGCGSTGRAPPELAEQLHALERQCTFSRGGRCAFHDHLARVGVTTTEPIDLPLDDQPYWFRCGHPLANFQIDGDAAGGV